MVLSVGETDWNIEVVTEPIVSRKRYSVRDPECDDETPPKLIYYAKSGNIQSISHDTLQEDLAGNATVTESASDILASFYTGHSQRAPRALYGSDPR